MPDCIETYFTTNITCGINFITIDNINQNISKFTFLEYGGYDIYSNDKS